MFKVRCAVLGSVAPFWLIAPLMAQSPSTIIFDATTNKPAPRHSLRDVETPQDDVLYDTLWITDDLAANAGVGNAIGGERAFPSLGTIDSEFADDFHLDDTYQITRLFVDYQSYFPADGPDEGFWVQFYANNATIPSESLYVDATVTPTGRELKGQFAGFDTYRYELDLSSANIVLDAGDWWVDVQPLDIADGGWFWANSILDLNPPLGNYAQVRDGWFAHGNSYYGLWGSTTWLEHNFRGRATPARRIEGVRGGGGARLRLTGSCPGRMTLDIGGATPNGIIAILIGFQTGNYTIPGGPCQGTMLGLGAQGLRIVATAHADSNGQLTMNRNAGTAACGKYLQAVDGGTCTTTNVVQIN